MKVELKMNDKSVQAEISEGQLKELGLVEQLKKLGLLEDKPKTGYERVKKGEMYYVIDTEYNSMLKITEFNDKEDEQCYNTGNYYNDKIIAENNARADRLLRQLRQWQAANDKSISEKDWNDESKKKWFVAYSYGAEKLYADYYYIMRLPNTIHFATKEKAEEAIEVFKDELLWYFTEYVQRLDEVQNG
jgi:hypothetical protein